MTRQYAANRIRELRKEIGLTQEDIAEGLGGSTTKGTVAKLEKGAMALSLDYIKGIAKVLGVDPAEIIAPVEQSARDVPLIGAVAAGNWREAIKDARESVPIPAWLHGRNLYACVRHGSRGSAALCARHARRRRRIGWPAALANVLLGYFCCSQCRIRIHRSPN